MKRTVESTEKFKALLNELTHWVARSEQNGSMEFATRNGFVLHAVSLWQGTGASDLPYVAIPRKREEAEIRTLLGFADIFVCPSCNHHSFFSPGEITQDTTRCESCLSLSKIHSRGKV